MIPEIARYLELESAASIKKYFQPKEKKIFLKVDGIDLFSGMFSWRSALTATNKKVKSRIVKWKKTCIGRCEIFSARSFLPNEFYAWEEKNKLDKDRLNWLSSIGKKSAQLVFAISMAKKFQAASILGKCNGAKYSFGLQFGGWKMNRKRFSRQAQNSHELCIRAESV